MTDEQRVQIINLRESGNGYKKIGQILGLSENTVAKITVTVFIVDYLLRWMTADMKFQGKKVVAFLRYSFSFFAIVDLLSILPSITILNSGFKLFKLFRLNKAFKVLKVLRYSKSFNLIISVVKREKKGLIAVGVLAGGYILLSALIMFFPRLPF